jgi:hypothetical protein
LTELAARWVGEVGPAAPQLAAPAATHTPAIAVWGALFACGCAILLGAAAIAWRQKPDKQPAAPVPARGVPRVRVRTQFADAAQEAATLSATAQRAAVAAAQARRHSEYARQGLEVAEQAYEAAQRAYEAAAANAVELPREAPGVSEASPAARAEGKDSLDAARHDECDLTHAALAAYRRGDITVEDLRRVWLDASGWDARHEDAEQELLRLRAEQLAARRAYNMARTVARLARRAEEVADVAAQALADEAIQASNEVAQLRARSARKPSDR